MSTAQTLADGVPVLRQDIGLGESPPPACHPRIARLLDYWQALSPGSGLLPGRQHVDPLRIPDLLTHLWMLDVVPEDPRRYRVRLMGGAVVEAGAQMRKGDFVTDRVSPSEAEQSMAVFRRIETSRRVDWKRGPSALQHMEHVYALERAMMPMASDGTTVDLLLCISVFYWKDGRVY